MEANLQQRRITHLADLITAVRREIAALRTNIEKQESALRDAEKQLALHEKIAAMLQGGPTPVKTTPRPSPKKALKATKKRTSKAAKKQPAKKKSAKRTNWNAVLEGLPSSFTVAQVKEAAGKAPNDADVHQALLRWRKAGNVTTSAKGQYKKA